MSVNKVMLIGRLGQDPELRQAGAAQVCTFSVATSEKWKDKSGKMQEKTTWHRITAWNALGETAARYLSKGREVYIEGRIEHKDWEKDGVKRTSTEIVASTIQFLGSKSDGGGGYDPASDAGGVAGGGFDQSFNDDDIPF